MAEVTELRQWWHNYYSPVVWQDMTLCFTVVGQAQLFVVIYILATSKVTPEWVPTCDRMHSWQFHSAASLGDQAATPTGRPSWRRTLSRVYTFPSIIRHGMLSHIRSRRNPALPFIPSTLTSSEYDVIIVVLEFKWLEFSRSELHGVTRVSASKV